MTEKLDTITPGEILAKEFLAPLKISQNKLARDIDVSVSRISGIIKGERAITADTALRLASYFGTSAEMWMTLQNSYDLRIARREKGGQRLNALYGLWLHWGGLMSRIFSTRRHYPITR